MRDLPFILFCVCFLDGGDIFPETEKYIKNVKLAKKVYR